jgi:hypothetical protein
MPKVWSNDDLGKARLTPTGADTNFH